MSTTVKYVGPCGGAYLPALGLRVERGKTIEVEADVAAELVERGDFERPRKAPAKTKAAAKKAAPKADPAPAGDDDPKSEE